MKLKRLQQDSLKTAVRVENKKLINIDNDEDDGNIEVDDGGNEDKEV